MHANFTSLRSSIARLQAASIALDVEKVDAEEKFREALSKLPKLPKKSSCHGFGDGDSSWFPGWVRKLLRIIRSHGPPMPVRDFLKAAKRVQRVNAKLSAFERGFISEEGIKGREWYKHLIVAPGKFLGEY